MQGRAAARAKYWYEWGDEGTGYVTVGYYNHKDVWVSCGIMNKDNATATLQFHNPHS